MEKGIDFNRSTLTWLTKSEKSFGRFTIEATMRSEDLATGSVENYYLLCEVMAGNVYGPPPLIKTPPYSFRAIFSDKGYFKILRTYSDHSDDSVDLTKDIFEDVDIRLDYNNIKSLPTAEAIIGSNVASKALMAMVNYTSDTHKIKMQFPMKHVNWKKEGKAQFQVETGPVLFHVQGTNCSLDSLSLAFVNFNCFDQLTYVIPESRIKKTENVGAYSIVGELKAEVAVFMID